MNIYQLKKDFTSLFDDYLFGAETFPKATSLAVIGAGLLSAHLFAMGLYFCIPGILLLLGSALEDNAHREIRRSLLVWTGVFFLLAQYPMTTGFMTIYQLPVPLFNKIEIVLQETVLGKGVFSLCFYFLALIFFTILEWAGEKIGRVVSIGGGDILFFSVMTTIFPFTLLVFGTICGSIVSLIFSFFWKNKKSEFEFSEINYKDYPPAIPGLLFGMGIAPIVQQYFN